MRCVELFHGLLVRQHTVGVINSLDAGIEPRECGEIRALTWAASGEGLSLFDGLSPTIECCAARSAHFPHRLPLGHGHAPPRDGAVRIRRSDGSKFSIDLFVPEGVQQRQPAADGRLYSSGARVLELDHADILRSGAWVLVLCLIRRGRYDGGDEKERQGDRGDRRAHATLLVAADRRNTTASQMDRLQTLRRLRTKIVTC